MNNNIGRNRTVLSQINVTPLVDVVLVLLIIFMVTAPMFQEGIDVNLPKVKASGITAGDEPLVITIDKGGNVYISNTRIAISELKAKLASIQRRKEKVVLIRADQDVPYGLVIKAMAEIREGGVERVGMITEPLKER